MSTVFPSWWGWRAGVCLAAALLAAATGSARQQGQQPSPEDLLKSLLRESLEDQLAGANGRVRSVRVGAADDGGVLLEVTLAGVKAPDTVSLECAALDRNLKPIRGFTCEHEPLVIGDSTVPLHLAYDGAGNALSVAVRVTLVDVASGKSLSRARAAMAREWGVGTGGGTTTASAADTGNGQAATAATGEPRTVDIQPVAVGDTPGASAGGLLLQPAPARPQLPAATDAGARSRGFPGARVLTAPPLVDLYQLAPQAKWSAPTGLLPWDGAVNDNRGFAKPLGQRQLADGKSYDKVLQTHPSWNPDGYITSSFDITMPSNALRFTARAGFLPGADASDGVVANVILGIHKIATRTIRPQDGVVELAADIPEQLRGSRVILHLMVAARQSPTQDWFVWVAPAIR